MNFFFLNEVCHIANTSNFLMKKGVLALDTQVGVLYFTDNKSAFVDDYAVCVSLTETESNRKTKNGKGELLHTLVFL